MKTLTLLLALIFSGCATGDYWQRAERDYVCDPAGTWPAGVPEWHDVDACKVDKQSARK